MSDIDHVGRRDCALKEQYSFCPWQSSSDWPFELAAVKYISAGMEIAPTWQLRNNQGLLLGKSRRGKSHVPTQTLMGFVDDCCQSYQSSANLNLAEI